MIRKVISRFLLTCLLFGLIFLSLAFEGRSIRQRVVPTFLEVKSDFPREEKNLKKWDRAICTDLDQDGFPDLILNDHGFGVRICWNNQGRYQKPYDLVMGDLHGIAVGDVDRDANLELIIARGGGAGTNARNARVYRIGKDRSFTLLSEYAEPLPTMRGRTVKLFDGDNDGDLDLINFAFPSPIQKGKSENYVHENDGVSLFASYDTLPRIQKDGQKTLITDFNGDQILDLILYGSGSVRALRGKDGLQFEDVTERVFDGPILDVTNVVELDYDNDGDFDLFFTRGKEFQAGETFFDSTLQRWGFFSKRGKFQPQDLVTGDVLQIENYFTTWPHTTIHLAETGYEYTFPGETHSGKDLRLINSDALGFVDQTTERGTYLGYVGNEAWRLSVDTWAPATGVFHGVRSYPSFDHEEGLRDLLLENQGGVFQDVGRSAGLSQPEHSTGAAVGDFDNNGYPDLIVQRRGDLIHQVHPLLYLNEGNGQFVKSKKPRLTSPELGAYGSGIACLDYNLDGKIDVIAGNERGKWHLFKNSLSHSNMTHYVMVRVGASPSGQATSLGAFVQLKACNMQQVRRVGASGVEYGNGPEPFVHFGLGTCIGPLTVRVTWTNGETSSQVIAATDSLVSVGGFATSQ